MKAPLKVQMSLILGFLRRERDGESFMVVGVKVCVFILDSGSLFIYRLKWLWVAVYDFALEVEVIYKYTVVIY